MLICTRMCKCPKKEANMRYNILFQSMSMFQERDWRDWTHTSEAGFNFFCFCVNRIRKLCWIKLISRSGKDFWFYNMYKLPLLYLQYAGSPVQPKHAEWLMNLTKGVQQQAFALSLKLLLRQLSPNGSSCSEEPPGINTKLLQYKSGWNKCLLAPVGQLARQKAIGYSL